VRFIVGQVMVKVGGMAFKPILSGSNFAKDVCWFVKRPYQFYLNTNGYMWMRFINFYRPAGILL
jgi:hypothetical protein